MTVNCSDEIPLSQDFFASISLAELICIILAGVLSLINVGFFIENALFVRKYEKSKSVVFKSILILGLYPAMTLFSFFAICFPKAFLVCNLCASVYIAIGMYQFMALLLDYFGGKNELLMQVKDEKIRLTTPPLCCCCVPPFLITGKVLNVIHFLVAQNALLQMVISFLSVVLWLDDKYSTGGVKGDNAALYLAILKVISTLLGVGGLRVMVVICKELSEPLNIKAKSQVLIIVLFLHNVQGFVFNILATHDIPECSEHLASDVKGRAWNNMIIIVEMFLLAVLARHLYHKPHQDMYSQAEGTNNQAGPSCLKGETISSTSLNDTSGDTKF